MDEQLQLRIQGEPSQPTLVYLPGLHGDWTLIGSFKRALGHRVRFVEITYPRTLNWSLDDYAANVESALAEKDITRGWLLGESFSSQVVWPMVARGKFQIEGIILAGGFVRHPIHAVVRFAERLARGISLSLLTRIMFGYAKIARLRYRHSPETMAHLHEFIARRTELDRQAAVHRLRLIAGSDFCDIAKTTKIPIFAITGALDPIVPWISVRPWLRRNCPALRTYKIVWRADHNVLSTAAETSANQIVQWMASAPPANTQTVFLVVTAEKPVIVPQTNDPMTRQQVLDLYFMDARSKLIDLAAFLDRVERADGDDDFRMKALRTALKELSGENREKAKQVLLSFSDPTTEPIPAATTKAACGAWPRES